MTSIQRTFGGETGMFTLIAIGFIGGLITGISPCILPVLPVILFSGTRPSDARRRGRHGQQPETAVAPRRREAVGDACGRTG